MDTRISLQKNTVLKTDRSTVPFIIRNEIARGGSCIVYDAVYRLETGEEKPVRLKECYPFNLHIERSQDGRLEAGFDDSESFEQVKEGMRRAYAAGNDLFLTKGLTNVTSNMLHCFEANNTLYIPSVFLEGEPLSFDTFSSLKDCINLVKTVAQVVAGIHRAGYLYLDIKPENVFVITNAEGKGATELVQLFDFDSLAAVDSLKDPGQINCRLSYTQGFAAIEHQLGNVRKLGFYTDVYSVGALLYYLVFGNPPSAMECGEDAVYNFGLSKYGDSGYQDKLFFLLSDFFHRALADYYLDRYQTMEQVIEVLKKLAALADTTVPYVYSTSVSACKTLIGREEEQRKIDRWFRSKNSSCLFLTGMGGIGKSSLMRKYIVSRRNTFDTVLYLDYQNSICETVTDDFQIQINTVEKNPKESREEYFCRKVKCLRQLLNGTRSLIVIDNFAGEMKKDFFQLLDIGIKTVILSRGAAVSQDYTHIPVQAIKDKRKLYRLFELYAQREIREDEKCFMDSIIEHVMGHTLVLELIGKQVQKSYMTLCEAEWLVRECGFTGMANEKIPFSINHETGHETIKNIVSKVFFYKDQNPEKRKILRALSLLPGCGVEVHFFGQMLRLHTSDGVNELGEVGWLTIEGGRVFMHPVIRETIAGWEWQPEHLVWAEEMMGFLSEQIRQEKSSDSGKMYVLLELAGSVLERCGQIRGLGEKISYVKLMTGTLLHMPRDREEFIIRHTEELIGHSEGRSSYVTMKLYKNLLSIYAERRDFLTAGKLLGRVKKLVREEDDYVKAQYYDMMAEFYDARLNGQYACDNEYGDLISLRKATDQAIGHIRRARGENHKEFLVELMLGKANIMIRSTPEEKGSIVRLLHQLKVFVRKYTQSSSPLRRDYAMTCAWYYTLVEPCERMTEQCCETAGRIAERIGTPVLDYIDMIAVPHANMLAELGNFVRAREILEKSAEWCNAYPLVVPYIRKKLDLHGYMMELYSEEDDQVIS